MSKKNQSASKEEKKNRFNISPSVRFIIIFTVLLILITVGFSQLFTRYHDSFLWLMKLTATLTGGFLSIFTDQVSYNGVYVTYKSFPVEIIDECTGLFEMLIYLAAVLAFSTTLKKKLIGLVIGLPVIYAFNVIRIIVLLIAGAESVKAFEFLHLYLWQVILIIMIASVWIGWLYLVVYREKR